MELPHFDSSPVQVSQCAGSSRGEGALFSLKGRAGEEVETFLHARSTRENLEFCLHPKEALCFCFRYGYMALILKFKSFNLVSQIRKQRKERKGKYTVCFTRYLSSPSPGLPAVI